jgi:hypothetical protein
LYGDFSKQLGFFQFERGGHGGLWNKFYKPKL